MMAPGMVLMPFVMSALERNWKWFARNTAAHAPFQVLSVGCFLMVMVPAGCALFPQTCAVSAESLRTADPKAFQQLCLAYPEEKDRPKVLYFNKGL